MDTNPADIRYQDHAHRRGLVLGLTMAEIMVLILFMLLLALGSLLAARDRKLEVQAERLRQLAAVDQVIEQLRRESLKSISVPDIIQRIEREQQQIADMQAEIRRLRPYESAGKVIDDIVQQIRREGGKVTPEAIVKRLAEMDGLRRNNETLKGQLLQLTNQIKATGRGNALPSCWVTKEGKTESLFELTLTAGAIRVRDHTPADREADRAGLPLSGVQFNDDLSPAIFTSEMQPIYQWSVAHGCRFYVIRYSAVESAPISLVNAISDYFYPDSRIMYRG